VVYFNIPEALIGLQIYTILISSLYFLISVGYIIVYSVDTNMSASQVKSSVNGGMRFVASFIMTAILGLWGILIARQFWESLKYWKAHKHKKVED